MKAETKRKRLVRGRATNRIAIVEWNDASLDTGPVHARDIQPRYVCRSVGLVVSTDDDHLTIALTQITTDGRYRHVLHIPNEMIKKVKFVEVKRGS